MTHRTLLPAPILGVAALSLMLASCAIPPSRGIDSNDDPDEARAAASLASFFQALHQERTAEAIPLFGGTYALLQDSNPDVRGDDLTGLLERACRQNGYQCLAAGKIIALPDSPAGGFRFAVEFVLDDGSIFSLGPCCGEDPASQPPQSSFEYTVVPSGDGFLVLELPPYVP